MTVTRRKRVLPTGAVVYELLVGDNYVGYAERAADGWRVWDRASGRTRPAGSLAAAVADVQRVVDAVDGSTAALLGL